MIHIKVEYDGYNRTFKLIDREFASILQDGGTYELSLSVIPRDLTEDSDLADGQVTSVEVTPAAEIIDMATPKPGPRGPYQKKSA